MTCQRICATLQRMTAIDDASKAAGRQLGYFRGDHRLRQEEVAQRARFYGLEWTRSIVAALETGRRRITLTEFLALPQILADLSGEDVTLADLLVGQVIETAPGIEVDPESLPEVLAHGRPRLVPVLDRTEAAWQSAFGLDLPGGIFEGVDESMQAEAWLSGRGEAEQKAARRIDVPAGFVGLAAHALWGRSFTAERDARVAERAAEGASDRSLQAIRGHVTRDLTEQVQSHLQTILDAFSEEA